MTETSGVAPEQPEQQTAPPVPFGVPPGGYPAPPAPPVQPVPYGQPHPGPYHGQHQGPHHPHFSWPFGHHGQHQAPPAYGQGYGQPGFPMPGYAQAGRDPDARPGTVLAAGIVTLVMAGLVGLLVLVFMFFLVVARESFIEGFSESADLASTTDLYTPILIGLMVFLVWCLAAMVLAVLVLHRKNWARICLVVSSALTIVVSLVAITGGVSIVSLAAAIAVIVCLFTGGAGDWFHREHAYSPPQMPKV